MTYHSVILWSLYSTILGHLKYIPPHSGASQNCKIIMLNFQLISEFGFKCSNFYCVFSTNPTSATEKKKLIGPTQYVLCIWGEGELYWGKDHFFTYYTMYYIYYSSSDIILKFNINKV